MQLLLFNMWPLRKPRLYLTKAVLQGIANECQNFKRVETGGLLIGYHEKDAIVITHITGPGPCAIHRSKSLEMDLSHIRRKLREHEDRLPVGYEGNWHTHPRARFFFPSPDDKTLMRDIVASDEYDITRAVLLIAPERPLTINDYHCYVFDAQWRRHITVRPRICMDLFTAEN